MVQDETLLVVGAGHAGAELAIAARQAGWAGPIVLMGEEPELPYHRPPLSKAYLHGEAAREALQLRGAAAYAAAGIELDAAARVVGIDREVREVRLADGRTRRYARLALCTGGRPRPLVTEGLAAGDAPSNLHYLRTLADADAIRSGLREGTRLVVVGGGYVGLELAASATKFGARVSVLEAQPRVLSRVTGAEVSAFYEEVHRAAGVELLTDFSVARVERVQQPDAAHAAIVALVGQDGRRVDADLVVAGIGMLPNVELAVAAGLDVDGGVVVDAGAVTSDPCIVAAGDCTVQHSLLYDRRLRLESVPNALEQARAAAATLCGKALPARAAPWFWSDQYDLKLQMVGLSQGHDTCVLRGDVASRKFAAFYLREGIVIAADAINRPADFMLAKRLVGAAARVDVIALGDESASLKDLVAAAVG
ncbi:MAG: FAD-dependent oxidoreductase [Burkholderiales bacterium]|nr:FAD-dependent oxidoreductase [Burkholderiales bacterium]